MRADDDSQEKLRKFFETLDGEFRLGCGCHRATGVFFLVRLNSVTLYCKRLVVCAEPSKSGSPAALVVDLFTAADVAQQETGSRWSDRLRVRSGSLSLDFATTGRGRVAVMPPVDDNVKSSGNIIGWPKTVRPRPVWAPDAKIRHQIRPASSPT